MKNNKDYKIAKSNLKSLKTFVIILASLLIAGLEVRYPAVYATLGYALTFVYDWLKHKWQVKLP